MAYKVFTNGSTLQASELNENLMQQSIAVFSNSAARTAAITSPVEGQMTWLEDVNRYQSWNGSAWVSPDDLTLIVSQTIGTAVSSVTVSNAFSSTYDNYKILISGGAASSSGTELSMKMGSASNGHQYALIYGTYAGAGPTVAAGNNSATWPFVSYADTNTIHAEIELLQPFLAKPTYFRALYADTGATGMLTGRHNSLTSFSAFTIAPNSGTLTGGTINVYGYRKAF